MSSTLQKAEHKISNAVNNLTVSTGSDVFSDNSPEESPSNTAATGSASHQRQDSEISVPQFHEDFSPTNRQSGGADTEEVTPASAAVSPSSDPSMALSRQNVALAKADTSGRVYRIYCDGVFDLFHIGHMRMLEQAKKSLGGDTSKVYLICGVNSDEQVHKYKGRTVLSHEVRCDSARHCKHVDLVAPDAPWVIDDAFIAKYKIDFVAHDAIPYTDTTGTASSSSDVYGHIKSRGMFLETQRTEGISTSDIIVEIVKGYDDFVRRNLARGYSKKDLNVGMSWEVRSRFHDAEKDMKEKREVAKQHFKDTEDAIRQFIRTFNPKQGIREAHNGEQRFTPTVYAKHLRSTLPDSSRGVIHHSIGLTKALFSATGSTIAYLNPFNCCLGRRKSKKE